MKISFNWIKELLNQKLTIDQTSDLLTDIGLEVEGIEDYNSAPQTDLSQLIIGKITKCEKHPNADKLKLTEVDIGSKKLSIICGAPNVETNQKVVVATVGTTLYTNKNEKIKIKKAKIRGIESHGMIVSEFEIGLSNNHQGIINLDNNLKIGSDYSKTIKPYRDKIFEIGITPNRSDALSHYGVARDLRAAISHRNKIKIDLITPSISNYTTQGINTSLTINIVDSLACKRFCGLVIKNISISNSHPDIFNKLTAIGVKPINNVVDITNYVMHELGQPLHAYDLEKIKTTKIEIKKIKNKSKFTTLDEETKHYSNDDLFICDSDEPMCLAGIMGGSHHSVSDETTSILLESAYFDPVGIRKSSKKSGISSDSSYRFERGADINMTEYALKRAASLLKEYYNAEIISNIIDDYPNKIEEKNISINFENFNKIIGVDIDKLEIKSILNLLDFKINSINDTSAGITIPNYRHDVTRECDVIEEVLRIYGYNNIKTSNKMNISVIKNQKNESYYNNLIASFLCNMGFNEVMNNSLVKENYINNDMSINLINSISKDVSVMRTDLTGGILKTIEYNINRKSITNNFFEFGSTYHKKNGNYKQNKKLTIVMCGDLVNSNWLHQELTSNFFYLKNIVRNIFEKFNLNFDEEIIDNGIVFKKSNKEIASIISIDKSLSNKISISKDIFCATIDTTLLFKNINNSYFNVDKISKFPTVKRDFSFVLNNEVSYKSIKDCILSINDELIKEVKLFDIFKDGKIEKSKKSISISVMLNSDERTLNEKNIQKISKKIVASLEKNFDASLRD